MKQFLVRFIIFLGIVACSSFSISNGEEIIDATIGGQTQTNKNQEFIDDPKKYMISLPTEFTTPFPTIPRQQAFSTISIQRDKLGAKNIIVATYNAKKELTRVTDIFKKPLNPKVNPKMLTLLQDSPQPPMVLRYGGTISKPLGNSESPLYDKIFVVQIGGQIVNFAYFDHPTKGIKIYSYDPMTNKLTDYEAIISGNPFNNSNNYVMTLLVAEQLPQGHFLQKRIYFKVRK